MTEPTIDDLRNLKDGDLYTNDSTVRRALINLLEDGGGGSDPSEGVQNPLTEDLAAGGHTVTGLPVYANVGAAPSTGAAASVGTVDNIAQEAASTAASSAVSQANTYTDNQIGAIQIPTSGTGTLAHDSGQGANTDAASGTVYWTRIGNIVMLHAEVEIAAAAAGRVTAVMALSGTVPSLPDTHYGGGSVMDASSGAVPAILVAAGTSFEISFDVEAGGVFEGAFTLAFQV